MHAYSNKNDSVKQRNKATLTVIKIIKSLFT